MTARLKSVVLECVSEGTLPSNILRKLRGKSALLVPKDISSDVITWTYPSHYGPEDDESVATKEIGVNRTIKLEPSQVVNSVEIKNGGMNVVFATNTRNFIKDVLRPNPTILSFKPPKKKIIVEFSSPNIAKEFHVGHLRSTMIGNFVSNLLRRTGNDVFTVNYLGDWGVQFGVVVMGLRLLKYTEDSLETDTINKLTEAYVYATRCERQDDEVSRKAREVFEQLENGDEEMLRLWEKIKNWSANELSKSYKRLGVTFDSYEWESNYNKNMAAPLIKDLEEKGILFTDDEGCKVVQLGGKNVRLVKSDGTTLYLMRDVLAFFSRRSRFTFDKMHYVVEAGQGAHFTNLFELCDKIEPNSSALVNHIKFGRITGVSTRNGTAQLMRDVLDEARDRMYKKQINTATTKAEINMELADKLGTAAIIINTLRQKRLTQYAFNWDQTLHMTGKSGVQLQYAYCRICGVIRGSPVSLPDECNPDMLMEPEALQLIVEIARFEEVLMQCEEHLESNLLISYMFDLQSAVHRALNRIRVKDAENHLASQRLLLFHTTKLVLEDCFHILGITPVEKM